MRLKSIQPSNKIGYSTLEIRRATAWRSKITLVVFLFAFFVVICSTSDEITHILHVSKELPPLQGSVEIQESVMAEVG